MAVKKTASASGVSADSSALAKKIREVHDKKVAAEKKALEDGKSSLLQSTENFKTELHTFLDNEETLDGVVNINDSSVTISEEDLKTILKGCDSIFRDYVVAKKKITEATGLTKKIIEQMHDSMTIIDYCREVITKFVESLGFKPDFYGYSSLKLDLANIDSDKKKKH